MSVSPAAVFGHHHTPRPMPVLRDPDEPSTDLPRQEMPVRQLAPLVPGTFGMCRYDEEGR